MRKKILFFITAMLILSGMGAVGFSEDDTIIDHQIGINVASVRISEKKDYMMVSLDGSERFLMNPNEPVLPIETKTFTFPLGTEIIDVECRPIKVHVESLQKHIQPAPQPVLMGKDVDKNENQPISYQRSCYPDTWYSYDLGRGLDKNQHVIILKVQLYPVQYYPSDHQIQIASDFELNIEYRQVDLKLPQTYDEGYDFVILTPSEFVFPLTSLVDHKNDLGISTQLVTLDSVYNDVYFPSEGRDNPEKIKYFIKQAIEQWDTTSVMLVGGYNEFPVRNTHVYVDYHDGDDEVFVSDLYYADIYDEENNFVSWDSNENDIFGEFNWSNLNNFDDVDLYPDVYLGRLAVTDADELTGVVNKIITYETNEAWKQDWFSEIMVIGGDTAPFDENNVDEGEYVNQYVLDLMTGFTPDKVWDSNFRLSWFNPSGVDNINNGFAEGRGFVDWAGHGAPTVWTTYPHNGENQILPTPLGAYRNKQILSLENAEKLPVVVVGACSTGKFEVIDCFAWSFVKNPNGGGIASLSATGLSWGYDTEYVVQGLGGRMHVSFFQAYANGAETFGQMWADGVSLYIEPNMDGGHHKTGEQWEPFGDPTLRISSPSQPPAKPQSPMGPTNGRIERDQNYTTMTTDPDGDDIYYKWDWGDGSISDWIGPFESGESCTVAHQWDDRGDYLVTVQARDVNGKLSDWSDPLPITMAKSKSLSYPLVDLFKDRLDDFPLLQQILFQFGAKGSGSLFFLNIAY